MTRGPLAIAWAAACLLAAASPGAAGDDPTPVAARASAWQATLSDEQRGALAYRFDDAERFDLRLAPIGLEGLRADDLSEAQWQGLLAVLGAVLSPQGLAKVEAIMSLEREVRELDRGSLLRWPMSFLRGERRYFLALFGEPAPGEPWGLRFDGHHVSLNWTFVPGAPPSVTPLFLGSQPREVPPGFARAGLRVLAEEEDRALALVRSLDPAQRERAQLPFEATTGAFGGDRKLMQGTGERVAAGSPAGVARGTLTPAQREQLDALIEVYVANFGGEIADVLRAKIRAGGVDAIHFAWAGGDSPGEPAYYRVQGPSFLIEFDDTVPEADHVHALWRDFDGDFGRDLLAEHHARAHAPGADLAHTHAAPQYQP